ncbi:hypothetical protein IMCC3317_15830 [Kordia antarctica]|uniref:Uncharacterized protein n=1 Tax=Kordia antarctica TaxID=1218801 RepID=A0A7L4ZJY9_9FLAO|nr:hypothetical protein [Kordia antarctica]QHI36224.1 hypothetical protein IMCC3317_15830 [Kordia antarctica]
MKPLLLVLILTLFSCSNKTYKNVDWMIQIDLSGTDFTFENKVDNDSLLNSNFSTFKLPQIHCSVENIDFQPEFRIYDKYLISDTLNYRQISDSLSYYLKNKFEILQSMMSPDDYGQLFKFVVQGENIYLYQYNLIDLQNKHYLIQYVSTYGTKRKLDKDLKKLIKQIEPIKN